MVAESIPAGYQLQVKSWENDGDNYKTQVLSGLTKTDVKFYLALGNKFRSKNRVKDGLGNSEVPQAVLAETVKSVIALFPAISHEVRESFSSDGKVNEDSAIEGVHELLGSASEDFGYRFCRVFETFKVFHFPLDVKNVTPEFID